MAATAALMTTEEFLALPDDGRERDLIRGEVREYSTMTTRGVPHALITVNLSQLLKTWLRVQPAPRGLLVAGEARVRLRSEPESTVGVDLAYISADLAARTERNARFIDGPPVLAVEILSPSDTIEAIADKVELYLDAGVALVWVVDPFFETVTIHRPDEAPRMVNVEQELTAEPHLPGLQIALAELFGR